MFPCHPNSRTLLIFALFFFASMVNAKSNEPKASNQAALTKQMQTLEKNRTGRIGVAAYNSANGEYLSYRGDETFAMTSTFKFVLVSSVLSRVDANLEQLTRPIKIKASDILTYAPVTGKALDKGQMTISELNAAVLEYSDNTGANLLLQSIGGPKGLTRFMRSLGDKTSRLDRYEPFLNSNLPGSLLDTTTPNAMIGMMQKTLLGDTLSKQSQEQLITYLLNCKTGDKKLRAGLPATWRVGDKTGGGDNGADNDIAIVWPGDEKPFLIAVYYTGSKQSSEKRQAVLADVGRVVANSFYPATSENTADSNKQ